MHHKTLLFNLDGTLTDSGEGIINCAQYAFEKMGYPVPEREKMGVFVGPPLAETMIKFGIPAEKTGEAIRIFRERYIPIGKYENKLYPGIPEMLQALLDDGWTLFVATSKPEITAKEVLEHFQLSKYFRLICGADMEEKRVEKADVIAYLLEQTTPGDTCLMIGDTRYDVAGAKEHGIATIGVSWGYGDVEQMREEGAIAIADTPQQLTDILRMYQ